MVHSRPEEEGRALAYVGSILFSIGLTGFAAIAFCLRALRTAATNNWSVNWPTACGQITTCDVKTVHGRLIDYALGIVGYSYQIDGNYYSGYLTRQFWDEQRAWTFVDFCKDKSILVHYKLGRPQTSVLREVDQMGSLPVRQYENGFRNQRFGPLLAILWPLRNVSDWAEGRLHKEARNWPAAHAIVDYAEPMIVGEDENTHWVGDLHYCYSVNGTSYSASHYFRASSRDDARDLVKEWRNRRIVVHYFLGNPSLSVFIPEEQDASAMTVNRS